MSGPVTTKWPLMNRMVNVVILDLVMPVDQHDLCYITDSGHAPRVFYLTVVVAIVTLTRTTIDGEVVEEPDMKLIESDRSDGPNE
jgi:hypothetical protein